VSENVWF